MSAFSFDRVYAGPILILMKEMTSLGGLGAPYSKPLNLMMQKIETLRMIHPHDHELNDFGTLLERFSNLADVHPTELALLSDHIENHEDCAKRISHIIKITLPTPKPPSPLLLPPATSSTLSSTPSPLLPYPPPPSPATPFSLPTIHSEESGSCLLLLKDLSIAHKPPRHPPRSKLRKSTKSHTPLSASPGCPTTILSLMSPSTSTRSGVLDQCYHTIPYLQVELFIQSSPITAMLLLQAYQEALSINNIFRYDVENQLKVIHARMVRMPSYINIYTQKYAIGLLVNYVVKYRTVIPEILKDSEELLKVEYGSKEFEAIQINIEKSPLMPPETFESFLQFIIIPAIIQERSSSLITLIQKADGYGSAVLEKAISAVVDNQDCDTALKKLIRRRVRCCCTNEDCLSLAKLLRDEGQRKDTIDVLSRHIPYAEMTPEQVADPAKALSIVGHHVEKALECYMQLVKYYSPQIFQMITDQSEEHTARIFSPLLPLPNFISKLTHFPDRENIVKYIIDQLGYPEAHKWKCFNDYPKFTLDHIALFLNILINEPTNSGLFQGNVLIFLIKKRIHESTELMCYFEEIHFESLKTLIHSMVETEPEPQFEHLRNFIARVKCKKEGLIYFFTLLATGPGSHYQRALNLFDIFDCSESPREANECYEQVAKKCTDYDFTARAVEITMLVDSTNSEDSESLFGRLDKYIHPPLTVTASEEGKKRQGT